jgi:TolB protein
MAASTRASDCGTYPLGLHLLGETYDSTEDNWRHIANIISDAVYQGITGVKGHFDAP